MKNDNTYSISEVSKMLGLSLKATRRMIATGQIEATKKIAHIKLIKHILIVT